MTRRSFTTVAAQAVAAERVAVMRFVEEHARQVRQLVEIGRCEADEAALLIERVRAFAGGIATGLHVGGDGPETRATVRAALSAAGLRPGGGP